MRARETMYKGHLFRSGLEARWAAFFDLLGWAWVYEPFELDGYIPDFVLQFKQPLLVEVKPALSLDALHEHTDKLERSGWEGEALIVGADWSLPGPLPIHDCWAREKGYPIVGWAMGGGRPWGACRWGGCRCCSIAAITAGGDRGAEFSPAIFTGEPAIPNDERIYHCRGGHGGSDSEGGAFWDVNGPHLHRLWGEAHRLTRWMPQAVRP